jgi:hypothetical protein
MTEFNAAEKRALAARTNAFIAMGKAIQTILAQNLALTTIPPGALEKAALVVPLAPTAMMETIGTMQMTVKQLEISLGTLVDMLLEEAHVCAVADQRAEADDKAPPMLAPSILTRENYLNRCAQSAEKTASLMTRGILSQGQQADPHKLIRPS